jgi:hypothetical protein
LVEESIQVGGTRNIAAEYIERLADTVVARERYSYTL